MPHTVGHDFRAAAENADELRREEVGENTEGFCHQTGTGEAKSHTFFHPVIFLCAEILSHESRQSHGKAGNRKEGETFDFGIGAAAGHGCITKAVDIGLNHQIGKGNDGILNTGGKTEPDDGSQTL